MRNVREREGREVVHKGVGEGWLDDLTGLTHHVHAQTYFAASLLLPGEPLVALNSLTGRELITGTRNKEQRTSKLSNYGHPLKQKTIV